MFNNIGVGGLLLIAVVVLVLFGRGKVSSLMGEVGKGITAFKRGVSEGGKEFDEAAAAEKETRVITPADAEARSEARSEARAKAATPGSTARDVTPDRDRL